MANVHCRCRHCGARQVKPKAPEEYVTAPVCRLCKRKWYRPRNMGKNVVCSPIPALRVDAWANSRAWRKYTCHCDGYHHPHRRGSRWCCHNENYGYTQEELHRERDEHQDAGTDPRGAACAPAEEDHPTGGGPAGAAGPVDPGHGSADGHEPHPAAPPACRPDRLDAGGRSAGQAPMECRRTGGLTMPIQVERVTPTWRTLEPEDEETLHAHGWRRLKHFNTETRRWEPTDTWMLLPTVNEDEGSDLRVILKQNGKQFQVHVEVPPRLRPAPSMWVGPRFDCPAAVSRYLWMIGDGDVRAGANRAVADEWGD